MFCAVVPINLLRVPLEVSNDLWVDEVVHNPTPQRTAPGLVRFFLVFVLAFDLMALELSIAHIVKLINDLKQEVVRSHRGKEPASIIQ